LVDFGAGDGTGVAEAGAVVGAEGCGDDPEEDEDGFEGEGRVEGVVGEFCVRAGADYEVEEEEEGE
jgi:hypothetical protein